MPSIPSRQQQSQNFWFFNRQEEGGKLCIKTKLSFEENVAGTFSKSFRTQLQIMETDESFKMPVKIVMETSYAQNSPRL